MECYIRVCKIKPSHSENFTDLSFCKNRGCYTMQVDTSGISYMQTYSVNLFNLEAVCLNCLYMFMLAARDPSVDRNILSKE